MTGRPALSTGSTAASGLFCACEPYQGSVVRLADKYRPCRWFVLGRAHWLGDDALRADALTGTEPQGGPPIPRRNVELAMADILVQCPSTGAAISTGLR